MSRWCDVLLPAFGAHTVDRRTDGRSQGPDNALTAFCEPRSVAVIGASAAVEKAGGRRWRSAIDGGFAGSLFAIHPTAETIRGHKAYRSIADVPNVVDLAVVVVPAAAVPAVVDECIVAGVRAIMVISAGFGEVGAEGRNVERRLVDTVRDAGGRLLGPNCAGLFSASFKLNLMGWSVPAGDVGFVTQSGGMAITYAQLAARRGLGFSHLLATGNASDIGVAHAVEFLLADPNTKVVVVYVEGLKRGEGRKLVDVLNANVLRKPVVVLKPGITPTGQRAVLSHTGNLAGEDRVFSAAMKQAHALRLSEAVEAWDAIYALSRLPRMASGGVAILADGGGTATVIADAAARAGLDVPQLPLVAQADLRTFLPQHASVVNPIDPVITEEQPEVIVHTLLRCFAESSIGGAIIGGHFGGYFKLSSAELGRREEAVAHDLVDIARHSGKPLVVHSAHAGAALPALESLRSAGIPVYDGMESAAKALGVLWQHCKNGERHIAAARRRSNPHLDEVLPLLARARNGMLIDPDARQLLREYGIRTPAARVATSAQEAAVAADAFGAPVALKLISPALVHKSDIGGVLLDITGRQATIDGFEQLLERAAEVRLPDPCVLVTPMLPQGVELIVGAFHDGQFGPVTMFGLGGILVEAFDDVAFRLAPLNQSTAQDMIAEVNVSRVLSGVRGRAPCDIESLVDMLVRVGELVADLPQISEMELNPVLAWPTGVGIADVRVLLAPDGALA